MIEPLFDFEKGEFVFSPGGNIQLVTGIEELKNQIRKAMHTPLGRYKIYDGSGWGTRIEDVVIGKNLPREYKLAEVERCIRETIENLYGVERVDGFNVKQSGDVLTVKYNLHTIFGKVEDEEVLVYG